MSIPLKISGVRLLFALLITFLLSNPAAFSIADNNFDSRPVFNPEISINRTNVGIDIDGDLKDQEWQNAKLISNFVERSPGENLKPKVKTEAYLTFDENNLYIAFKCFDDPATIRATMSQRDQYSGDDAVIVLLDTYGNADWAYEFYVNPYGIQKDLLWNSVHGDDSGFDLIWHTAAKITSFGYQVEIAIPFSSLRFPKQDIQTWKIDFWRNHPRESYYTYSWSANNRDEKCWPCQWGTLNGISNVESGKGIELISSATGNQNSERIYQTSESSSLENYDPDGEMSLGGKYTIGSDVTVEASINPDFSQIEADAAQVDVNSTYALFFPERRPFFQEGADIFRTLFNSIYSRTIYDPQVAVKVTGRPGSFRFGYLGAYEDTSFYILPFEERSAEVKVGRNFTNIFRGLKSFGRNSRMGFLINDRRYEHNGSNTVLSLDGDFSLSSRFRFNWQYIVTHTQEHDVAEDSKLNSDLYDNNSWLNSYPSFNEGKHTFMFDNESYVGDAVIAVLNYQTRNLYSQIQYNHVSPNYRTQTGFDPVSHHRTAQTHTQYTFFFNDNKYFERISPSFSYFTRWNFHTGQKKLESINLSYNTRFKYAQTSLNFSFENNYEYYENTEYKNMRSYDVNLNMQLNGMVGYYAYLRYGESIARSPNRLADQLTAQAGVDFKPIDRFFIEPNFTFVKGDDKTEDVEWYRQFILRSRFRFQFNQKLSLRLVVQYNYFHANDPLGDSKYGQYESRSLNLDPLLTYRLNPYTVFYLGVTTYYQDQLIDYSLAIDYYYDERDFDLQNRQFFAKIQYLFQI